MPCVCLSWFVSVVTSVLACTYVFSWFLLRRRIPCPLALPNTNKSTEVLSALLRRCWRRRACFAIRCECGGCLVDGWTKRRGSFGWRQVFSESISPASTELDLVVFHQIKDDSSFSGTGFVWKGTKPGRASRGESNRQLEDSNALYLLSTHRGLFSPCCLWSSQGAREDRLLKYRHKVFTNIPPRLDSVRHEKRGSYQKPLSLETCPTWPDRNHAYFRGGEQRRRLEAFPLRPTHTNVRHCVSRFNPRGRRRDRKIMPDEACLPIRQIP